MHKCSANSGQFDIISAEIYHRYLCVQYSHNMIS